MLQLSPKERALLHLYDARSHISGRPSEAVTQEGVASALGVNRTHITRVIKPLIDAGHVEETKGRLDGKERKLKYYVLTPLGLQRAKELIDSLGEEGIELVEGGRRVKFTVRSALEKYPHLRALELVENIGGVLRPQSPGSRLVSSNIELRSVEFLGREGQLATAKSFLEGEGLVLAIYANHGYGSSTFLCKVALDLFDGPILWHDLIKEGSTDDLRNGLDNFAAQLGLDGMEELRKERLLICLDNYRQVNERLVDMLMELVPSLRGGSAKLAVAMREETPSYDRFYARQQVTSGEVIEVRLHRFDEPTARVFLGKDLDDDAFQLIYMLTRGQPLALDLVKRGDAQGLKGILLSEEVRFLMYLRTRRKSH